MIATTHVGSLPRGPELVPVLLARDKGKPEVGDIKASANTIKRTLSNFGIEVEMGEVEAAMASIAVTVVGVVTVVVIPMFMPFIG